MYWPVVAWLAIGWGLGAPQQSARLAEELHLPIKVTVAGKPLDIGNIGHAAPFVGDVDGDGVRDLLVGEFQGGRIRFYRNLSSNKAPRFDKFVYLQAGGKDISVPAG